MSVELKSINKNKIHTSKDPSGEDNLGYLHSTDSIPPAKCIDIDSQDAGEVNGNVVNAEEDTDDPSNYNPCSRCVLNLQRTVVNFFVKNEKWIIRIFLLILLALYIAYFIYAMWFRFGDEGSYRLLGYTVLGAIILFFHFCWKYFQPCTKAIEDAYNGNQPRNQRITRWFMYIASLIIIITTLIYFVAVPTPNNLVSLGGLAAFLVLTYITSVNPAKVDWHPIYWGLALQYFFALFILKSVAGFELFQWLGNRVTEFLAYTDAGSKFVFGDQFTHHFFAFSVMPVVTFFSTFIAILYYLGVMQAIVKVFGRFLSFCLGTTPAESLNAAGNIFVGMTEAPLMIKPFLPIMTKSELHAVMTGGFATIAGSVFGAYLKYGVPGNHLLSASVMSAPAALAISKLTYPETEKTQATDDDYNKMVKGKERNVIEAASAGASLSIGLIANIIVNLIAFLALLELINTCLAWAGDRVGVDGLSFQFICSYVLYPVALFMGTELSDCRRVAELVGIKTFTNEFIAYGSLSELINNKVTFKNYTSYFPNGDNSWKWTGDDIFLTNWNMTLNRGIISDRSEVISTYALCGFSNIGSMGILLGGLSALAPERRGDLSSIVLRAMIAGNVACFFTACIAGLFYDGAIAS